MQNSLSKIIQTDKPINRSCQQLMTVQTKWLAFNTVMVIFSHSTVQLSHNGLSGSCDHTLKIGDMVTEGLVDRMV